MFYQIVFLRYLLDKENESMNYVAMRCNLLQLLELKTPGFYFVLLCLYKTAFPYHFPTFRGGDRIRAMPSYL